MIRDLATIGIAVGGPVALVTGIFVGVTLIGGPHPTLFAVFLFAVGLTGVSLAALAYEEAKRRTRDD